MFTLTQALPWLLLASVTTGTPVHRRQVAANGYAPVPAICPAEPLVRPANGLNPREVEFIAHRYEIASQSLAKWLATTLEGTCAANVPNGKRSEQPAGPCKPAKPVGPVGPAPACQGPDCDGIWKEPVTAGDPGWRSGTWEPTWSSTGKAAWSTASSSTGGEGWSTWSSGAQYSTWSSSSYTSSSSTASLSSSSSVYATTSTSTTSSSAATSPATTSSSAATTSGSPSTTSAASTTLTTSASATTSSSTTSSASSSATSASTTSKTTSSSLTTTSASSSTTSAPTTTKTTSATSSSSSSTSCSPESFKPTKYPMVGLTTSGGGYRSLLVGAGVIQGFDARDSDTGVSGVFQGLTYEAGLSGGAWLLSSFAANDWPTISSLQTGLWEQAFFESLLVPGLLLDAGPAYTQVVADIVAKEAAGFPPTLTDPWGRLLSYQLLYGADGGVADTDSGLADLSNFTSFNIPYPIITAIGVPTPDQCVPDAGATQYEVHPYEFGSWDTGVDAFTITKYLGSSLVNGQAGVAGCVTNYDNQGYILGTSSNLFNEACVAVPPINSTDNTFTALAEDLATIVANAHTVAERDNFAIYPNPFYQYPPSTSVSAQESLYLVDGGETDQNNPIWPFLHRPLVDVLLVNDNSADTSTNYPNGSEIYNTYQQAQLQGVGRMPVIPDADTFVAQSLNLRPTFFGCNDPSVLTIIYFPNQQYTFNSGVPTAQLEYPVAETDAMIANGQQVATKGGDPEWPLCLACGIMKKAGGTLPSGCAACYTEYCYN